MKIIDAHIHFGDDDPALLDLMEELDLTFLNICVAEDDHGQWREQAERYGRLARSMPARFAWCTSFDLPRFDDEHYVQATIDTLDRDFEAGAVACKIWKNIGMEVVDPTGSFMMPDHALLDPIYAHLAKIGKPLLAHLAEPLACWRPLDEASPHYGYYSRNPQWHMLNKPNYPSHEDLIAARDNIMLKHPTLRFIGAHLGSLEYDVDEVAARFRRFPQFAVDISARLADLATQESAKVRQFFLDWPDRILFGTDVVMRQPPSLLPPAERARAVSALRATYQMHLDYVKLDTVVDVRGRQVEGLGLPAAVLDQFLRTNAQEWYPGL